MARNPNEVGSPGHPGADGGHQSSQQAEITEQGGGGKTDAERDGDWARTGGGQPKGDAPSVGGSSQGQSDRKPADREPTDR